MRPLLFLLFTNTSCIYGSIPCITNVGKEEASKYKRLNRILGKDNLPLDIKKTTSIKFGFSIKSIFFIMAVVSYYFIGKKANKVLFGSFAP